ncbi:MAG TPA: transposase [Casimicrobiaceae bacterium]|nr:transposase [Casimicrobiaceae bacterium]
MSRRPRFLLTDLPLHVVQRGNDRRACFFEADDYAIYLEALAAACSRYRVLVHAYVLMTNHVHLLVTPLLVGAVSRVMQSVGARYVRHVNRSSSRSGTLWEGRYHACLVASDEHVLAACRYIDRNPVRAGLVPHVSDYRWSSYRALAGSRADALVTPHAVLDQLGTPRADAYARWCANDERDSDVRGLREATARELAFGSDAFKQDIQSAALRATFVKAPGFARRSDS